MRGAGMTVAVSYIPTLLFGLGAIADAFRVSPERVKRWIEREIFLLVSTLAYVIS